MEHAAEIAYISEINRHSAVEILHTLVECKYIYTNKKIHTLTRLLAQKRRELKEKDKLVLKLPEKKLGNFKDSQNEKNKLFIKLPEQKTPLLVNSGESTPNNDNIITPYNAHAYKYDPLENSDYFYQIYKHIPSAQTFDNSMSTIGVTSQNDTKISLALDENNAFSTGYDIEGPESILTSNYQNHSGDSTSSSTLQFPRAAALTQSTKSHNQVVAINNVLGGPELYEFPIEVQQDEKPTATIIPFQSLLPTELILPAPKKKSSKGRKAALRKSICAECGETLLEKNMKNHNETHTNSRKKIKCAYEGCQSEYFHKRDKDRHERFRHLGLGYICSLCNQVFDRQIKLTKHQQRKHKH